MSRNTNINFYLGEGKKLKAEALKDAKSKKQKETIEKNFNLFNNIIDLYKKEFIRSSLTLDKYLYKIDFTKANTNINKWYEKELKAYNDSEIINKNKIKETIERAILDRVYVYPMYRSLKNKKIEKEVIEDIEKEKKLFFKKLESDLNKLDDNKITSVTVHMNELNNLLCSRDEFSIKLIKITDKLKTYKLLLNIDGKMYTLNDNTRKRLLTLISDQIIGADSTKSDEEFAGAILAETKTLIITKVNEVAHYKKDSGEFFKYLNKTDIDLTDYQIYTSEQFNQVTHDEACLYFALSKLGLSDVKLSQLKILIKNRNIPLCDIQKICDKIQVKITVKKNCADKRTRTFIYGKEHDETYNLGLIDEHYFAIKDTNYTSYSINNYDKIKHIKNYNNIINDKLERKNRFIDSFDLINLFFINKDVLLDEMTYDNCNIANTQFYDKINDEKILNLEYNDETSCRLVVKDENKKNNKSYQTVFFDFETYRNSENIHKPYLLCAEVDGSNEKKCYYGSKGAKQFLKSLEKNSILIAHNVSYDYRFIIDELFDISEISRGSKLLGCNAKITNYKGKIIEIKIKDSYHLIGQPLRKFNKIFKLSSKKEIMPYDLYTEDNINKKYINKDECLRFIKDDEKQSYINNVEEWNLYNNNNEIDIIEYSKKYCEIDVEVLKQGYNIFRSWMNEHFNIDTNDCLTIASLAHKYLINSGCYDDVYELSSVPQMFIQGCVVGGRTMTNNNDKQTFNLKNFNPNKKMQDFDAVSLYPSAMKRMKGFLKGKPKVLKNMTYDFLRSVDGYFIEIIIKKVGINRDFSLMSYKTEEGIRLFTNDMINKKIKVDKTTLEDLIEFHKIEFEIVRGYYFDEGYNNKINETIEYIFSKRLELKKDKNPAELTYKLIMNNAYGKSIMKPIENEIKLFTNKKDFEVYIDRNYNWINSFNTFGKNDNKYKVKVIKKLNEHYNICQVGVEILSMSKRIMNEVMSIAQDNNLKIYYQDTDSMHIEEQDINILQQKYNAKYNRELIGKNMGQFHSDFELDDCEDVYASRSIFLGKKSYIDELKGTDKEGNIKTGYHIRMKGVPNSCIEYTTKKLNLSNPFELYEKMLEGKEITFDLTEGGNKTSLFEFTKDYKVITKTSFERKIKF